MMMVGFGKVDVNCYFGGLGKQEAPIVDNLSKKQLNLGGKL